VDAPRAHILDIESAEGRREPALSLSCSCAARSR